MPNTPDEKTTSAPSTEQESVSTSTSTSSEHGTGTDAAAPAGGPAKKILIGSQRDSADPEMGTRKTIRDATLNPGQIAGAIQGSDNHGSDNQVSEKQAAEGGQKQAGVVNQTEATSNVAAAPNAADANTVESDQVAGQAEKASPPSAKSAAAALMAKANITPEPKVGMGDSNDNNAMTGVVDGQAVNAADAELEAALDDLQMDSLMDQSGQPAPELEMDARIKALVTRIHNDNVFFSLKGRYEGVASMRQFKEPPEEGAMLDVTIVGFKDEEGLYEVAIPGAAVSVADWSDLVEGAVVEGTVTGSNTGGLEINVNNIRGFIPASQIDIVRVENFGDFVNKKLQCVVVEVNERRRKLVVSRRAILEREQDEKKAELMKTLAEGQTHEGIVSKLMDFGAFVNIGGVEGLVHVSKMSWERVSHPKEVLEPGQKISVKVEKINQDTGKISLSYRDTLENPWQNIDQKYPEGAVVGGTVSRLAQFGAFVKLEPGVEGLVHISELAHHRVVAVKNVVKTGDSVQVKVLSVDPHAQKIGLSLKATQAKPEKASDKKPDEVEEPLRESAVKKRDEPLKGGRDRSSGGEQFGLNW